MAEILPFRRSRRWTTARDYGVATRGPKRRRSGGKGGGGGWLRAAREMGPILWVAPLALGATVFFSDRGVAAWGGWFAPPTTMQDKQFAHFGQCGSGLTNNCVIDGDTFWYRGDKIRVADINTPETSSPKCAAEAELGARAARRFAELMNAGAFTLEPVDRSHDKYGRALFVVTRGGESVGGVLVAEGLAEEWQGFRGEWC